MHAIDAKWRLWFHHLVHKQIKFQFQLAIVFALLVFCVSITAAQPGVELSPGELVVDFAWADRTNLTLLVKLGDAYAMRRLDLENDEISVIPVPGSFSRIDSRNESLVASVAPQGNAVAFLGNASNPLGSRTLLLYRLDPDGLETVNMRRIPHDFHLDGFTWGPRGETVYLWARHYLEIDQPYSIGSVHLRSGMFTGISTKAEIDLVENIVLLPGRDMLAVKCLGFMSDYPDSSVVVGVDVNGDEPSRLHGQAGHLLMNALASGELMLYEEGCGDNPFNNGKCELWLLTSGEQALSKGTLPDSSVSQSVQATRDGGWIAYLQASEADSGDINQELKLRRTSDNKPYSTKQECSRFALSPWGEYVCAASPDHDVLYFFPLPE